MPEEKELSQLTVLHDHYKDSYAYIREGERQRDRLFLIILVIIGVLFFEVLYPTNLRQMLAQSGAQKIRLNIDALPMPALISVTWTILAAITLRYCQAVVHVERQYEYLHKLENKIAPFFQNKDASEIYRREGQEYLQTRAIFSNWVWIFYTFIFPLIVLVATGALFCLEFKKTNALPYHLIYDCFAVLTVWASFILYKMAQCYDGSGAK